MTPEKLTAKQWLELSVNLLITVMLFYMLVVGQVKTHRLEHKIQGLQQELDDATGLGCEDPDDEPEEKK